MNLNAQSQLVRFKVNLKVLKMKEKVMIVTKLKKNQIRSLNKIENNLFAQMKSINKKNKYFIIMTSKKKIVYLQGKNIKLTNISWI